MKTNEKRLCKQVGRGDREQASGKEIWNLELPELMLQRATIALPRISMG